MSWSLQIRHGDLVIGGTRLAQVAGTNKLVQDLRCVILEKMGTDDLHPSYGSIIDGGRRTDGTVLTSIIGQQNTEHVAIAVRAEIERLGREHQEKQLQRAQDDRFVYGKTTLTAEEVLEAIAGVDITLVQDQMLVRVVLRTARGQEQILNIPLSPTEPNITTVQ